MTSSVPPLRTDSSLRASTKLEADARQVPITVEEQPNHFRPDSYVFEWDGRQYAFGGRWMVFRRHDRRAESKAMRESGATHWIRVPAGADVQVSMYCLSQESGRIYAAAEAVRSRFGSDFAGVFDFQTASIPKGYWVIAISDEFVLCDLILTCVEAAKAAYKKVLAPGRHFSAVSVPQGFADNDGGHTPLSDFLDLSEYRLRRTRSLPKVLTVGIVAAATFAGTAALAYDLLNNPDQASVESVTPQVEAVHTEITPIPEFVRVCELAVANGLQAGLQGWSLASAACRRDATTLQFQREPGSDIEALSHAFATADIRHSGSQSNAILPLRVDRISLQNPQSSSTGMRMLRQRLTLLDKNFRVDAGYMSATTTARETFSYELRTLAPAPIWLRALSEIYGAEISSIDFIPREFSWHIKGLLHVRPD